MQQENLYYCVNQHLKNFFFYSSNDLDREVEKVCSEEGFLPDLEDRLTAIIKAVVKLYNHLDK